MTSASCACSRATPKATPASTTAGCATRAASPTRPSTSRTASPGRSCATAANCARCHGSGRSRPPPASGATRAASGRSSADRPPTRRASSSSGSPARRWTPRTSTRGCGGAGRGVRPADLARTLAAPELQAAVPDIEFAHTVLLFGCDPRDDSPILDLRIRKGVRRNRVRLVIATARPTALEANATTSIRYAPGGDAQFAAALEGALDGATDVGEDIAGLATLLRDGGEDVVILFGERIGAAAAAALIRIARRLGLAGREGAGLLALPAGANGRGLREAGAVPDAGPGFSAVETAGRMPPRSAPPPRTARSPRFICSGPTRCATSPTAPCGGAQCTPRRSWSPTPRCSPRGWPSTPPSSSPPSRTPRRRDAGAPRRPPATSADRHRPSRRGAAGLVGAHADRDRLRPEHRRGTRRPRLRPAGGGSPVLRGAHARGDRRERRALAHPSAGPVDGARGDGSAHPAGASLPPSAESSAGRGARSPEPAGRPTATCGWGPTARSGPRPSARSRRRSSS